MKTIILLGELGKRYGRKHRLDVKSAAEAVRALCANFKDFSGFVSTSQERNVGYRVINVRDDVSVDDLHNPVGKTITIAPVIAGAGGGGGLVNIIIGATLIAASVLLPPGPWTQPLMTVGIAMALGGAAQLLSPVPKTDANTGEEIKQSYVFSGAVNTTSQGQPVPFGYGRMIVGSAVISAGISVEDITE
jgi:predicted phage tail protein